MKIMLVKHARLNVTYIEFFLTIFEPPVAISYLLKS